MSFVSLILLVLVPFFGMILITNEIFVRLYSVSSLFISLFLKLVNLFWWYYIDSVKCMNIVWKYFFTRLHEEQIKHSLNFILISFGVGVSLSLVSFLSRVSISAGILKKDNVMTQAMKNCRWQCQYWRRRRKVSWGKVLSRVLSALFQAKGRVRWMVIDCETCIMKQQFVLDAIKVGDLVQSEVQVDIYVCINKPEQTP